MKIKNLITAIGITILGLLLSACGKPLTPGSYDASEVGKINKVVPGVIISKRVVNITPDNPSVDNTPTADAINPANTNQPQSAAENDSAPDYVNVGAPKTGFEYIIQLSNGQIISVVQAEDLQLKVKQSILVIYGATTRVVADEASTS